MIAQMGIFVRNELEEGIPNNCENYPEGGLRTKVP